MFQILGLFLLCTGAAAVLPCTVMPGILTQIDAGNGQVYGVNSADNIYQWVNQHWKQIPGQLIHVSTGSAGVWGVNRANVIFKWQNNNWFAVNGRLKQIDAGGNKYVVGTNAVDAIFCLNQDQTVSSSSVLAYTGLQGSLKYYSCGPYGCWGVNADNNIYYRYDVHPTSCRGSRWQQIPGSLVMVEVGSDGSVYGVNFQGNVYRRDGISASNPAGSSWTQLDVSGTFKHVSYDRENLWLLTREGVIYKCRD